MKSLYRKDRNQEMKKSMNMVNLEKYLLDFVLNINRIVHNQGIFIDSFTVL